MRHLDGELAHSLLCPSPKPALDDKGNIVHTSLQALDVGPTVSQEQGNHVKRDVGVRRKPSCLQDIVSVLSQGPPCKTREEQDNNGFESILDSCRDEDRDEDKDEDFVEVSKLTCP